MRPFPLQFRSVLLASLVGLLILVGSTSSYALTVQDVPNPKQVDGGWVTDMAELLSPGAEAQLNQMITGLEAKNGSEIAVVTVPETAPSPSPKAFATELFNYWGIGKADINNGVLFLVSKGDLRVEIDTGYGIEPILPNDQVANIIDVAIISRFKQQDFEGGIVAGTRLLIRELEGHVFTTSTDATSSQASKSAGIVSKYKVADVFKILVGMVIGASLLALVRRFF